MNDLLKEFDVLIFETRIHLFNGDKVTAAQKFQEAIELLEKNGYSRSLATKTRIGILVKWPAPLFRLFIYFGRFLFKARKITFFILRLRSNYLEWRYRANNVEEADLDMTFEELRTAVRKNPKNIKKRLELAGAHKQIREFDLALREVDEIISISPNNPEAYNIKAGVLDSLKDYAGALGCYSKAIFLKPNNSSYFVRRGLLLFHLSNLEEALSDFSTAIRIHPKQALYYAHRGMALSRLGRKSDSEKDFEKAFKLKAGAYAYVDKAMIAALDLDVGNTVSNLKLAYDLNPAGTLDIVKFDPCFEKIKTLPAFREFMVEIDD